MTRTNQLPVIAISLLIASIAGGVEPMVRLKLDDRPIDGKLLLETDRLMFVLGRDGHLWHFAREEAKNLRRTSANFRGYSQSQVRQLLLAEFGRKFEVTGTGHYLVVHPQGERDRWAQRFEALYRSFVHYFTVRGLRPQTPQFPLIAVVFNDRSEFLRYAADHGIALGRGTVGYYSRETNRIYLYDQSGRNGRFDDESTKVVIHEATHQTAFNTGVHSRFAAQPLWVVEGLGTMFEAPGVWDSRRYPRQSDRVNRERLEDFKDYVRNGRLKGSIADIVSTDRAFQVNPIGAYAESWALSFYLAETQPRRYFQYMKKVAAREPFLAYKAADRLQDFTDLFGDQFEMLDAQLLRFIDRQD